MNTLSITAIIPAHNRAQYVGDAVESVLRQDRPVNEIIVVDDGSSDGTVEEVGRFGEAVVYVPQAHAGVAARGGGRATILR